MSERSGDDVPGDDDSVLDALAAREGWRVEGAGARVHYSCGTDRYTIEYYAPTDSVLYWTVPDDESARESAVPVPRTTVPTPLRERIREDLRESGIDPAVERETV